MKLDDVPRYYDRAARHYDRSTDLVFGKLLGLERYRRTTLDLLGDVRGKTVVDVGCGTGRNLPLLAEKVGAEGRILALDYSEGMLARARTRVKAEGWTNVELMRDDAATLESVQDPVDAIVSVWCLGIVHDLDAVLRRIVQLLRPRGRLAIMDFERSRPDQGALHWLYPVYKRLLTWAGIDSPEDLDDRRLREKWARGKSLLRTELDEFHEEHTLRGAGIILAGAKPSHEP